MLKRLLGLGLLAGASCVWAQQLPHVERGQLIVDGKPFLVLGGELGNSSAGTAAQADEILPRMAKMHVNTVLMPVAWEQIEPLESRYDFSILDHWIDVAREQNVHLVPLWFGSWKNGFSNYAPVWVKADAKRFPRAMSAEHQPTEILSTLGLETLRCDSRAFAALMKHVREKDAANHTALFVQVENEVGFLGRGRDRSKEADKLFHEAVPRELVKALEAKPVGMSPVLAESFNAQGKDWAETFGESADEAFMAWHYATYINAVAAAGKAEYALPMYVNVQLPAPGERAGEYPSGGPHPDFLAVYRAAGDRIDWYSPDIYWPNLEYWVGRYRFGTNPVFVPEAQIEVGPFNALYVYGEARGIGFCPFGIDSLKPETKPLQMQVDEALASVSDLVLDAQAKGRTRGVVLHATSPRPTQTVALGGYLFEAALSRTWPAKTLATDDGGMMVVQTGDGEFLIVGVGMTVNFYRDPDVDDAVAGISSIEEVTRSAAGWDVVRRLNGDQSNQGRQLAMEAKSVRMYRVKLYSYAR